MPPGFHLRSAYKYATVNYSVTPPRLETITNYLESSIIEFIKKPANAGNIYRVYDFKRGRILEYLNGKKLVQLGIFPHELPNELKYLVQS